MGASELHIGLMSGTSLDGVDAALMEISGKSCHLLHAVFQPFNHDMRAELLALNQSGHNELLRASITGNTLASHYASAVSILLSESGHPASAIAAIGCHGQTVRHRPDLGFTIQIGNPSLLAELSGIAVIADFRNRDIAAGGQGAPLVPAFHDAIFRSPHHDRVIVNIGGISNLTWLPRAGRTSGFDCGPGNLLLDGWAHLHLGVPFDRDGAWAASGRPAPALLDALLQHPFFSAPPPKSTGRDMFHLDWLHAFPCQQHAAADIQATLLELSARAIADAICLHCRGAEEIYLCGGGAHNAALRIRLAELLQPLPVALTDTLGIGADWVEAAAFAWLACQTLHGWPANLPEVTGARGPRVLGAIYPA